MMKRTEQESAILDKWPVVTADDIELMNDEFPHYIFFRRQTDGGVEYHTSCCGRTERIEPVRRTEQPWENALLDASYHNQLHTCPWCSREVTMKDLSKAGRRKGLVASRLVVLLHGDEHALYADALSLRKEYETLADLTTRPTYCLCSGYRFAPGDVMQIDYQAWDEGFITWERGQLSRKKEVQEPFKTGSLSFYTHDSYAVIGREVVETHPFFQYCQYFDRWQYRPSGPRGYAHKYDDLISYLTAYSIYPRQIEMLVKAGLYQPVSELICRRKRFAAVINWDEPDPRKAMGLSGQELSQLLAIHPDFGALECRAYANRHLGTSWDVEDAATFWNMWGLELRPMEVLRFCRRYQLPLGKLLRYLDRVTGRESSGTARAEAFIIYRDYLDASYHLGRCMEHSAVLWPEVLFTAHDEATDQWAMVQLQEAEAAGRGKQPKGAKDRARKYEFELDGLLIKMPMSAAAIRLEGQKLQHCVGGYAKRHLDGVLTILFLRKADAPHTPYVTIEMQGNQLRQIHGFGNDAGRVSPSVKHKGFLESWLQWLQAGSPRDDAGRPKIPKKQKRSVVA